MFIIFGSRSRAFKNRWSPAADCSVSLTIGGRIGSRRGGCPDGEVSDSAVVVKMVVTLGTDFSVR